MRLTAAVTHEPPWYVARCLDVEVTSQGQTVEEALENLKEADRVRFAGIHRWARTKSTTVASGTKGSEKQGTRSTMFARSDSVKLNPSWS